MDDNGLEILPWGRDREAQARLDRKRQAGRQGLAGCGAMIIAAAVLIAYLYGYVTGASL